jgi:hypothetical protein
MEVKSPCPRSSGDSNRLYQLGIHNHTTYAGIKPIYISLHPDPPKRDRIQRHPSTVHLQSNPWPRGYMLLSPSLHSQCAVGRSHDRITEILGLSKHAISYKVSTKQDYNERSLTDTVGDTTLGLLSQCKSTDRPQIIIFIH